METVRVSKTTVSHLGVQAGLGSWATPGENSAIADELADHLRPNGAGRNFVPSKSGGASSSWALSQWRSAKTDQFPRATKAKGAGGQLVSRRDLVFKRRGLINSWTTFVQSAIGKKS